jgi:two-component system, cell cycle sensor histidine kinase and response regulator CckA
VSRGTQPLAGRHIVVAEDVEAVRRTIERGLARAGARVTGKEDGLAALELLGSGVEVDLVLTDLVMPRMGGVELARELGRIRPELPIAFMTGYADVESIQQLEMREPHYPVLNKPFTIEDLVTTVCRALER